MKNLDCFTNAKKSIVENLNSNNFILFRCFNWFEAIELSINATLKRP